MKNKLVLGALLAITATPAVVPVTPALAYDHHYYHGRGGHYRHRCGGGNGAVGTIAGGVGGALIGNAVGGGVLGTAAGGVGGALLGRHLDKSHTRHRRGC
ncbi:hypothetical protein [uncultured Sphingomonas sp.]|uniref:hypothetical protein n=1 Tax=uncultured Sphingomonas sp. TaxID=158754 RepID=UPI0026203E9B|nr:hypothetical protein [uncultured Sphingomonas sp.]